MQNAHNIRMDIADFVTDMAQDALERRSLASLAEEKTLKCGISKKTVKLRDAALAAKIGRSPGVYVTFDCPTPTLLAARDTQTLQNYIAGCLVDMLGVIGRRSTVLVVGLGNDEVTADSLGSAVTDLLDVSPVSPSERRREKVRLCAVTTGVEGRTGIRSADTVAGICAKLRPSCVIAVDSLATSSVKRLGASYQLTTAGIAPGSGVGGDKPRIDKSVLGVPVVAIGVPTVLSMRTVLRDFAHEYALATGGEENEFKLRELMADKRLGQLVVAPKEVGFYVCNAASIVAGAINSLFGENT